jgi:hypothetical protein
LWNLVSVVTQGENRVAFVIPAGRALTSARDLPAASPMSRQNFFRANLRHLCHAESFSRWRLTQRDVHGAEKPHGATSIPRVRRKKWFADPQPNRLPPEIISCDRYRYSGISSAIEMVIAAG